VYRSVIPQPGGPSLGCALSSQPSTWANPQPSAVPTASEFRPSTLSPQPSFNHFPSRLIIFDHLPGTRQGYLPPRETVPRHSFCLAHDDADLGATACPAVTSGHPKWPSYATQFLVSVQFRPSSALPFRLIPDLGLRASGFGLWSSTLGPGRQGHSLALPPPPAILVKKR
jgi:hypothetical protein